MTPTVAVVGGGYGGIAVAKALDEVSEVRLIEPRETFVHNVAALRAVVDPAWVERLFLPYDRLLSRGRVVRDRALRVYSNGVEVGSGERIEADYVVLATGSRYPFPAKLDLDATAAAAAKLRRVNQQLAGARRVLLLGAGPVGLELAGEIKAAWPEKSVTILDPAAEIVAGDYPAEFRAELRRQLSALGVTLTLGTRLAAEPVTEPGVAGPFTVATESGRTITADIWFRCHGTEAVSDYLAPDLAGVRDAGGHIRVTDRLSLPAHPNLFAIGDVTAIPEPKRARAAAAHAQVVAANISALIKGDGPLTRYEPEADSIVLPLGPAGGATYAPGRGVLGAAPTVEIKGAHLFVGVYRSLLRLEEPAARHPVISVGSPER